MVTAPPLDPTPTPDFAANAAVTPECRGLQGGDKPRMDRITETAASFTFGSGLSISRRFAHFSDGFGSALRAESHFYKPAFDFPDLGLKGHALVFQAGIEPRPPGAADGAPAPGRPT